MANFYGQTRSNYFAVKNEEAFREEIAKLPVELIEGKKEEDGTQLFGFLDCDQNGGADIWGVYDEETEEYVEVDWAKFFQTHLADDWVAVIVSVGTEKYRYFQGDAVAYNNKGETRSVNIEQIYELASDLGSNRTHASY